MSSSNATVMYKDGTKKFCHYHNTSDVTISHQFDTEKDRDDDPQPVWLDCSCGKEEDVEIQVDGGDTYKGRACRDCGSIIQPYDPIVTKHTISNQWMVHRFTPKHG